MMPNIRGLLMHLPQKKTEKHKTLNTKELEKFARIVIYAVMALGIAMNAAVALSIVDLTRPYFPQLSTTVLSFIVILIPSLVNMLSAKYTAKLNTGITTLTVIGLVLVIILGLFTGTKMNENTVLPIKRKRLIFFMVYLLQFSHLMDFNL